MLHILTTGRVFLLKMDNPRNRVVFALGMVGVLLILLCPFIVSMNSDATGVAMAILLPALAMFVVSLILNGFDTRSESIVVGIGFAISAVVTFVSFRPIVIFPNILTLVAFYVLCFWFFTRKKVGVSPRILVSILFILILRITSSVPSIWGLAVSGSPNQLSNGSISSSMFFPELPERFLVVDFNSKPSAGMCWYKAPSLVQGQALVPRFIILDEVVLKDELNDQQLFVSRFTGSFLSQGVLGESQSGTTKIFRLSRDYFMVAYPGMLGQCPNLMTEGTETCVSYQRESAAMKSINSGINSDLQLRWFVQGDKMLCGNVLAPEDEDVYISLLESFQK